MGKKRKVYKIVATLFLFVTLASCFVAQVWQQVVRFYTEYTSQAVVKVAYDHLRLPKITFCLNDPYKEDVLMERGLTSRFLSSTDPKKFRNEASFPDLEEVWKAATFDQSEFHIAWTFYRNRVALAEVKEIETVYSGRCFELNLKANVSVADRVLRSIEITYPANKTGYAYLHHGDVPAVAISLNKWGTPVISMDVLTDMYYEKELREEHKNFLPSDVAPCEKNASYSYYKCLKDFTVEVYFSYYKAANCSGYVPGPCWIPQASSIPGVTTRNLTVCRNWDEYACMTSALRTAKGMADFVCPRSCRERRFEVVSRSAALLKKNSNSVSAIMKIFYGSMTVLEYNEYVLYDLGTIVGTVGGTMGLFLGFSCFHCLSRVVDKVLDRFVN